MAQMKAEHPDPYSLIRSPSYFNELHSTLEDLRSQNSFVDFIVQVGDSRLPCHKIILAAACPYFAALLESGMKESEKEEVRFDHFDSEVIEHVIDYMYTGNLLIKWDKVKKIIEVSEFLQLSPLKAVCAEYTLQHIDTHNCIGWYSYGDLYNMKHVKEKAEKIMHRQFSEVSTGEEFKQLTLAEVIDYIKNIKGTSIYYIVTACMSWSDYDLPFRSHILPDLFQHIPLEKCSIKFLETMLQTYHNILKVVPVLEERIAMAVDDQKGRQREREERIAMTVDDQKRRQREWLAARGALSLIVVDVRASATWTCSLASNTWHPMEPPPQEICSTGATSCALPNGFVILGGTYRKTFSSMCCMFQFDTASWVSLKNMPTARDRAGAVYADSCIYAIGGHQATPLNTVEIYHISSQKWQVGKPLLKNVPHPMVARVWNFIYVVGRETKIVTNITLQRYDTYLKKWEFGKCLPNDVTSTRFACCVTLDSCFYILGGDAQLCLKYAPEMDVWNVYKGPGLRHYAACAVANGDTIMLLGGTDANTCVEEYCPHKESWNAFDVKLPSKMVHHHAVLHKSITMEEMAGSIPQL